MKKILFLISKVENYTYFIKILLKFDNTLYSKSNSVNYNLTLNNEGFNSTTGSVLDNVNSSFTVTYKNSIIDIITDFSEEQSIDKIINKKQYDDIIAFTTCYDYSEIKNKITPYRNIYLALDEIPFNGNDISHEIKKGSRIISSSNITLPNDVRYGYFYDYRLAFLFYYYYLGFYHLDFSDFEIKKQNILGFYHRPNYKVDRDAILHNIHQKFTNLDYDSYIKNYSKEYSKEYDILFDIKYYLGWEKNHTTSYTDYMKSTCIFIVESDVVETYHPTEKIIKSILFSKLNIPSILYCSSGLFIEVVSDGYWFLNCEFIDFDIFINEDGENRKRIFINSIYKSVDYILSILKDNNGDLEKTTKIIKNNFTDKLQNHYKIFKNTISDIGIQDELMDFILDVPKKKIELPKLIKTLI